MIIKSKDLSDYIQSIKDVHMVGGRGFFRKVDKSGQGGEGGSTDSGRPFSLVVKVSSPLGPY